MTRSTGDLPINKRTSHLSDRTRRTNAPALRRRAEAYRDKADALEAMLKATQDHFAEAFATADAQVSTRDRINAAARKNRRLGGRAV